MKPMKSLMVGAALTALAVASAQAQSSPTTTMTPSQPTAAAPASQITSGAKLVTSQQPDQWLASKFKGTDVLGTDDKKIGDVSDVLFDKTGKVDAFIVSVGGILGMGSKEIALAPDAFDVVKGSNGSSDKLKLSMSKDELKQAQNFEPYKSPQATTGAGSRSTPAGSPLGSGVRPSSPAPTGK